MKNILFSIACLLSCASMSAQNLADRLGYPEGSRLLIIHADDIGMAHSQNTATFESFMNGSVNSGSCMIPCPWMAEVADWAKENPDHDLGIHLTMTNEWKHYKWGPVTSTSDVPGLINDLGFLYPSCEEMAKMATVEEVEKELRAQIEQCLKFGIKPTHFDSHMGCLVYTRPEFFEIYVKLGREYDVPVLIGKERGFHNDALLKYIGEEDMVLDRIYTAIPSDFANGMSDYYVRTIKELEPGVSVLLLHCAFDNHEFQGVSVDHPAWGSAWRQEDYDFFTSDRCKLLLESENIQVVTYRELYKKWKEVR